MSKLVTLNQKEISSISGASYLNDATNWVQENPGKSVLIAGTTVVVVGLSIAFACGAFAAAPIVAVVPTVAAAVPVAETAIQRLVRLGIAVDATTGK